MAFDRSGSTNKAQPYEAQRADKIKHLNGEVRVDGLGRGRASSAECRHFAYQALFDRRDFELDKADGLRVPKFSDILDKKYGSESRIQRNIDPDAQIRYDAFRTYAHQRHAVADSRFGEFVHEQLEGMRVGQSSQFLLETANHAMTLNLSVKANDYGERQYVISIYDPNKTNSHIRQMVSRPQDIRNLKHNALSKFFTYEVAKDYKTELCMLYKMPENLQRDELHPQTLREERMCDTRFMTGRESPRALRELFAGGMPLDQFKDAANRHEGREKIEYLRAGSAMGQAINSGHTELVDEYSDLLQELYERQEISAKDIYEVVAGPNPSFFKQLRGHSRQGKHVIAAFLYGSDNEQQREAVYAYARMVLELNDIGALTTEQVQKLIFSPLNSFAVDGLKYAQDPQQAGQLIRDIDALARDFGFNNPRGRRMPP